MYRKRSTTLFLLLALVVVAAGAGWLAGALIQSPAEAAARTAPPTPAPILVPLEERVLTSAIITRGTARYGQPQPVTLAPSALKAAVGVVTTLPAPNATLEEGDRVLTASGRPVFVLQGAIPVYRDLTPGSSGPDVQQVEAALQRLGFDPGVVDGVYDEQTSAAVAAWYTDAGWSPFAATTAQRTALVELETALAVARNQQAAAADAVAAAPLAVAAARANAESARQAAAAVVEQKRTIHATIKNDPTATSAARANAEAELAAAEAAVHAAEVAGEVAIQAALNAQKAAKREAVVAATTVTRLETEHSLAQQQAGVKIPADELVFLPTLPVRVEQVTGTIGAAAGGQLLQVTNHQLVIDGALPLDEAALVKPGMTVMIDEPDLGIKATGLVTRVAGAPGTDGVDGYHIYFETQVSETEMTLEGVSLRLTIPVESTDGAVTVAPLSALSLTAEGHSIIQVEQGGALTTMRVEPGLSTDGFVAVTPLDGALAPGQLVVIGYTNQE